MKKKATNNSSTKPKQLPAVSPLESLRRTFLGLSGKLEQNIGQLPTRGKGWRRVKQLLLLPFRNKLVGLSLLAAFFSALAIFAYLLRDLPSPHRLTAEENFSVSTQIFDRNGVLLYEIFADENRIPIKLEELPVQILQATIATEDQNFYHHFGLDLGGILRAVTKNFAGERLEGGSTITQQLVKNALLTPERSWTRKIKEAVLSVVTEVIYSKAEILEMYLNYISYGGTAVGIESAAHYYFDKSSRDLNLAEAAMLAGLPQAPSTYSPFGSDPQRAKNRQVEVLRRMAEEGYISNLQAEEAKATLLEFALKKTDILAPHFVFYVRDLLYEQYGVDMVEKGGLRVTTSLDIDLQEAAQASLSTEVENLANLRVGNGAALITKPNTGEILSMVGSRNYFDSEHDGQVNVTLARRQPGSSIKPIVYSTAFQEKTLNPGTLLLDIPTCIRQPNQPEYCPRNYTGDFKGPVTVRQALGNSLNIPAVKAIQTIGVAQLIDQASRMGITGWQDPANYGPSLALGGGEVRMIDMAQAFGVLANQGVKMPLLPILKIEDFRGQVLQEADIEKRQADLAGLLTDPFDARRGEAERVMEAAPAYLVSHILQDNTARTLAFGTNSQLVIPEQIVSVKTGTTNDLKDNWTIGFTPEFLTIVWVGNNNNTPMSYLASGITGAAPIFNDIMSYVLQGRESVWQNKPADVTEGTVCPSGLPRSLTPSNNESGGESAEAGDQENTGGGCTETNEELYWLEGLPSRSSIITKEVWIKPETGLPPEFGEIAEGLVLETHTIYQDPVTALYCDDCTRAIDEEGKIIYEKNYAQEVLGVTDYNKPKLDNRGQNKKSTDN